MNYKFNTLFSPPIAQELNSLCEFIDDLRDKCKSAGYKIKWSKSPDWNEYGFYLESKSTDTSLYCGIWFELWEAKGVPFCLVLDDLESDEKCSDQVKSFVNSLEDPRVSLVYLEDLTTITFSADYFQTDDSINSIFKILKDIKNMTV